MWSRRLVILGCALLILAARGLAGPAEQYRGPVAESPRAIVPPGPDGLVGTERLISRSGRFEGRSRWEFWWEVNRDRYLRRALAARDSERVPCVAAQIFSDRSEVVAMVTPEDVKHRIVPVLVSRLDSSDAGERAAAAIALGRAGNSMAFGELRKLLEGGTPTDRRAACLGLGLLGEPLAAPVLLDALRRAGRPAEERAYAALALGLLRAREAGQELARILGSSLGFRGRGLAELQSAAAAALGMIGDGTHFNLLAQVAGGSSNRPTSLRAAATVALGRLRDPRGVPVLLNLLGDKEVEVRRAAAGALAMAGAADAAAALRDSYRSDPDVHVRGLCAIALAELGGKGTAAALEAGLAARNPRAVRGFSALALGLLGDPTAAAALRRILELPDEPGLRAAAAVALGLLGDTGSVGRLRDIAEDRGENDDLRGYAVEALSMLGDSVTGSRLSRHARDFRGPDVRRSAVLALGLFPRLAAAPAVLSALFEDADPWVRGAAISSLSLSPRRSVMDGLIGIAGGRGFSADARCDALTALGVLAAAGRPSAAEPFLVHANYRSLVGAQEAACALF